MRCYSHLSDDEREQIGLLKVLGHSIGSIARAIRRPKSTVSREISRNRPPSGRYSPLQAYQLRRRRGVHDRADSSGDARRAVSLPKNAQFGLRRKCAATGIGDGKITIGPDTAIWIARPARITDIKVGSAVTMTGVKREDWVIAGASSHHWSGRGRQSTTLAEPRAVSLSGHEVIRELPQQGSSSGFIETGRLDGGEASRSSSGRLPRRIGLRCKRRKRGIFATNLHSRSDPGC
jgi:Helix-turn-helix domain